ncbi:N-acetyltransferase [Desulfoluna sp.]|uniref:GNAT family N-acetyltransferase n=1 Tax=Desulfoluna sp. TaxID=2045199 RepID=UPI002614B0FE|nr:GNAT family N-acetyltransferase [Desulfoluna sp.]
MPDVKVTQLNTPEEITDFNALFSEYTHRIDTLAESPTTDIPSNLVEEIRRRADVVVFLAYKKDKPAGFAVAIEGFSTFRALPVLNIHDLGVSAGSQKQGVGTALLQAIGEEAKKRGCCKLSLEVYEHNADAFNLYQAKGFSTLTGNDGSERTLFMVKQV